MGAMKALAIELEEFWIGTPKGCWSRELPDGRPVSIVPARVGFRVVVDHGVIAEVDTLAVQFADEVADNEPLDEHGYVPFREAYPVWDGWKVVGCERWTYDTSELIFHGPKYFVERGSIYAPGWHVRRRVRDNYLVSLGCFDEESDALEFLKYVEENW